MLDVTTPWNHYFIGFMALALLGLMVIATLDEAFRNAFRTLAPRVRKVYGVIVARIDDGPVCGHCRYMVRGVPAPICPECGSDLRTVGIRRKVDALKQLLAMAFVWTLVMGLLTPVASDLARTEIGIHRITASSLIELAEPGSREFRAIVVRHRMQRDVIGNTSIYNSTPTWELVDVQLEHSDGRVATLEPISELAYAYNTPAGRRTVVESPLDADAIGRFAVAEQLDMNVPPLKAELAYVSQQLKQEFKVGSDTRVLAGAYDLFDDPDINSFGANRLVSWWPWAWGTLWFGAWVIGLLIARRAVYAHVNAIPVTDARELQ